MKKREYILSFAFGLAVALASCGRGRSGSGDNRGAGDLQPRPTVFHEQKEFYFKPAGWEASSGTVRRIEIPVGKWPSDLDPNALVPACMDGKIPYLDNCWDSVVINIDDLSVTFHGNQRDNGAEERIAVGEPIPRSYRSVEKSRYAAENGDSVGVFSRLTRGKYDSENPLCSLILIKDPATVMYSIGLRELTWDSGAEPWAIASCFHTWKVGAAEEKVSKFEVKTLLAFGETSDPNASIRTNIVHYWHYHGKIVVDGKDYPLPLSVDELSKISGISSVLQDVPNLPREEFPDRFWRLQKGDVKIFFFCDTGLRKHKKEAHLPDETAVTNVLFFKDEQWVWHPSER